MKKDFTSFEKSIKEGLGEFEMPFDAKQWENLEMRLDGRSASSLNTMAAAVVTALIFISGITYFSINKLNNTNGVANNATIENSDISKSISNSNFQEDHNAEKFINQQESILKAEEGSIKSESNIEELEANDISVSIDNKINSNETFVSEVRGIDSQTSEIKEPIKNQSDSTVDEPIMVADIESEEIDNSVLLDDGSPMISVSAREVCAGEKIEFTAENITDESKFLWNFGNADFSTEINPVRSFSAPGEYNISLILSKSSRKIESKIIVLPQPEANFTWREEELGLIRLSNQSEKAGISEWKMDHEVFSTEINPSFDYHEEGKRLVSLRVENEFGCADSSLRYIKLTAPVVVTAPESFQQGQSFAPSMQNPNEGVMSFSIHNMRGQLIYESENGESWDGTMPDGTYAAPNAEFPWLIRIKNLEGKEIYSDSGKVKVLP